MSHRIIFFHLKFYNSNNHLKCINIMLLFGIGQYVSEKTGRCLTLHMLLVFWETFQSVLEHFSNTEFSSEDIKKNILHYKHKRESN